MKTMLRQHICALEVWVEGFRKREEDFNDREAEKIERILENLGWVESKNPIYTLGYGINKTFFRPEASR